jgi:hypothetical protein
MTLRVARKMKGRPAGTNRCSSMGIRLFCDARSLYIERVFQLTTDHYTREGFDGPQVRIHPQSSAG